MRGPMLFRRFYCVPLAQACYVLGDGGEAIVIDPPRDASEVLAFLGEHRLRATHVLGTHVHADFVAGLGEVSAATGARIGLGARFSGRLACDRLDDGAELRFGAATLRVLHTPGHTPESVCLLASSPSPATGAAAGKRLFTGDTLFVGDVGRPDLAQGPGVSAADMADTLFTSLRERLAALPDDVEVWPAHGAGSACGSCIASAPSSTLGAERADNWALREQDPARFRARLLGALKPPPPYFAAVAAQNRDGPALLASLPRPKALARDAVERALQAGASLLDVRPSAAHGRGHWPGALNLGGDGNTFETWAGTLLPRGALVLHANDEAQALAACRRLRRIGHDDVGGFTTELPQAPATLPQLEAIDLAAAGATARWQVVDVRRPEEFAAGHIAGARHCELSGSLAFAGLDRNRPLAVICETGYRSSDASRLFARAGFTDVHNVRDGMRGWRNNQLPMATGAVGTH